MKKVLITGSSKGFGFLTANALLQKGYTVFATMRNPAGNNKVVADQLREKATATSGTVHVLDLDVTSDASVDAAVAKALELEGAIDVVVNNAGLGNGGQTEAFSVEQFRKIFEVNLFGVQRVNRAVLPQMRERGEGLLVHVSSTLGRIVFPFCGPYVSSKFALEGLAESYRYELAMTGVDSVIVEPGGYATDFFSSMLQPSDEARVRTYGPLADAPEKMWSGMGEMLGSPDAPSPQLVADAVLKLVETPTGKRPLRTVVDPMFGDGPININKATDQIQAGLMQAMQMGDMIAPKGK